MIAKQLVERHPDVGLSVSCTTRAPRPGEIEGVHYHFVTDEQFDELVRKGAFYEWALVHQNRYGTLKSTVQEQLAQGHDLILEIDVQGCLQAMEQDSEVTGIFVSPPSRENLEKRLRAGAFEPVANEPAEPEEEVATYDLVRVKKFPVKPMHVDDAIAQMELLGHTFFLFLNEATDTMNVLYRRHDGSYGLLQPEM